MEHVCLFQLVFFKQAPVPDEMIRIINLDNSLKAYSPLNVWLNSRIQMQSNM